MREPGEVFDKLMAAEEIADKEEEKCMKWELEFRDKMEERRQQSEQEHQQRILRMMLSFMQ